MTTLANSHTPTATWESILIADNHDTEQLPSSMFDLTSDTQVFTERCCYCRYGCVLRRTVWLTVWVCSCLLAAVRSLGKMQNAKKNVAALNAADLYTNHHEVARHVTSSLRSGNKGLFRV